MTPPHASWIPIVGIAGLSLLLLWGWCVLLWRAAAGEANRSSLTWRFAAGLSVYAAMSWALAASGTLAEQPRLLLCVPLLLVAGVAGLQFTRIAAVLARATPLWLLIGMQGFRLPLELVMHEAAVEGVMPVQMTFGAGGFNYDIVTGVTALLLAALLRWRPECSRWIVWVWNVIGSTLLVAIVAIAVTSTPLFARFGSAPSQLNTWVFFAPFVWLPAVLVGSALLGHALIFRRLLSE